MYYTLTMCKHEKGTNFCLTSMFRKNYILEILDWYCFALEHIYFPQTKESQFGVNHSFSRWKSCLFFDFACIGIYIPMFECLHGVEHPVLSNQAPGTLCILFSNFKSKKQCLKKINGITDQINWCSTAKYSHVLDSIRASRQYMDSQN